MTLTRNGYDTKIFCRKLTLIENKSLKHITKKKYRILTERRGLGWSWAKRGLEKIGAPVILSTIKKKEI